MMSKAEEFQVAVDCAMEKLRWNWLSEYYEERVPSSIQRAFSPAVIAEAKKRLGMP